MITANRSQIARRAGFGAIPDKLYAYEALVEPFLRQPRFPKSPASLR